MVDVNSLNKVPATMGLHLQKICCSEEDADVYFKCMDGDQQVRIPAHKFVLSLRSDVMKSMFYGSLPEAHEVEITDITAEVFRHMLKFIYSDVVDIPAALAPNLLYAAKKYMLYHLVDRVDGLISKHLQSDGGNASSLLMLQNFMLLFQTESATFETCLKVIDENANKLLQSDEFVQLNEETVNTIIQRDGLDIPEEALYRCLLKWSAEECKRRGFRVCVESHRAVLAKLIRHIHFTTFTVEQISKLMVECRILSDDIIANLFIGCSNAQVKKSITFFDNKPPRRRKVCCQCRHKYYEGYPYICRSKNEDAKDKHGGACGCVCADKGPSFE